MKTQTGFVGGSESDGDWSRSDSSTDDIESHANKPSGEGVSNLKKYLSKRSVDHTGREGQSGATKPTWSRIAQLLTPGELAMRAFVVGFVLSAYGCGLWIASVSVRVLHEQLGDRSENETSQMEHLRVFNQRMDALLFFVFFVLLCVAQCCLRRQCARTGGRVAVVLVGSCSCLRIISSVVILFTIIITSAMSASVLPCRWITNVLVMWAFVELLVLSILSLTLLVCGGCCGCAPQEISAEDVTSKTRRPPGEGRWDMVGTEFEHVCDSRDTSNPTDEPLHASPTLYLWLSLCVGLVVFGVAMASPQNINFWNPLFSPLPDISNSPPLEKWDPVGHARAAAWAALCMHIFGMLVFYHIDPRPEFVHPHQIPQDVDKIARLSAYLLGFTPVFTVLVVVTTVVAFEVKPLWMPRETEFP
jgi:hypothetical protein